MTFTLNQRSLKLRCPVCHAAIPEPIPNSCNCGHLITNDSGIPVLLRDPAAIHKLLASRLDGDLREGWYRDDQSEQASGPYRHHLRRRLRYLSSVLTNHEICGSKNDESVLLDLGCGDGENLTWLRDFAGQIYASDYNALRISRITPMDGECIFIADITDYPALDESFDIVFFNHVLEHIPNDRLALEEVRRITKNGGLIILGVPNEGSLFWRIAYRLQPKSRLSTDHVHFYRMKGLKDLCLEAGLSIQSTKYIGYGIPHWSLDRRLRSIKFLESLLEAFGKVAFRNQASSIYLILRKN